MDYRGLRTYRRFKQEPVPDEVLAEMMENVRIASCARNGQVLNFATVKTAEVVADMQPLVKWAAALPKEIGTPVKGEQPTAFIAILQPVEAASFSDVDVGIAAHTLTATAWEHGIGSCIMGAINVKAINELLKVPDGYKVRLVIALGYPSHSSTVVDQKSDGSLKYYVDEERNYYVPKRPLEAVVRYF